MTTKTVVGTKKILVIEDETYLREILRDNLQGAGFAVWGARTGPEGYDTALKVKPDIILLDILLPGMDGMAVMKKLRQDSWGKTVPIMLITNLSASPKILQGVVEDRPVFYLEKSGWSIREIIDKVRLLAFYSPLLSR